MSKADEGWVRGLIAKHPVETIRLLAVLANAGLARGTVTANDLDAEKYENPHVVGAVFKIIRRLGFVKTGEIVTTTRPSSNRRFVLVWRLVDSRKAMEFVNACRGLLLRQKVSEVQEMLPM